MRTLRGTQRRDRGSMLVIALGVLALLSILAVTFVSLMKLELLASKNYVDGVKARLIAEGGMEEAITELKSRGGLDGITNINDDWVFANGDYSLPLEDAKVRNGAALVGGDRLLRTSYDGNLGGSYTKKGDRYKIQVIDAQAQFNLNNVFDGLTLDPAQREVNLYTRALRVLGEAIRQLDPRAKNVDPIARAAFPRNAPKFFGADAILAFRQTLDSKQFSSKYQLTEIMASEEDYKILRPYVTTKSWMDTQAVSARNHDIGSLRNGVFFSKEPFTDVIQVPPNPGDLPQQRAPINVNLASLQVLTSNLAGLAGRSTFFYYGDRSKTNILQAIDNGTKYSFSGTGGMTVQEELEYSITPVNVYFDPMGYKAPTGATTGGAPAPPMIEGALAIARLIDTRRRQAPPTGSTSGPPVVNQGPFKSHADFERWVDQTLNDQFFTNTKNKDNSPAFPLPNTVKILNIDDTPLKGIPDDNAIRAHPRFRPWFFDCLRSIIKANFNPNGRVSMQNPNQAIAMEVDKGNLLYFSNPTQPTAAKFNVQTCEWSFGSKGIFEIISLGEVLNANPKVAGELDEKNPIAQAKILTVIQIFDQVSHTSQRDFERNGDAVSHKRPNSSSGTGGGYGGFGDEKGQVHGKGLGHRAGVISYPYPKQFWDPRVGGWGSKGSPSDADRNLALWTGGPEEGWHAHDTEGHLEIAPRIQTKDLNTNVIDMGLLMFQLLFQDRHVRVVGNVSKQNPSDSFCPDISNTEVQNTNPGIGAPWEGFTSTKFATPEPFRARNQAPRPDGLASPAAVAGIYSGVDEAKLDFMYNLMMTPDGYYSNALRNLPLYYRASDRNSGPAGAIAANEFAEQGESVPNIATGGANWKGGNIEATPTGGVEFWYKPDFDWYLRQKTFGAPGADPSMSYISGAGGDLVDDRFCGFIVTCHNVVNKDVSQANWSKATNDKKPRATRGIEAHVMRDTSGDLRVTRIYFEVCGQAGNELPFVSDIKPVTGGPDPAAFIRLGRPGLAGTYMELATSKPEYTWPPYEFQTIPAPWSAIKYARVDSWIPVTEFKGWRAHEWHHIAVRWDDRGTIGKGGKESVEFWLDGKEKQPVTRQLPTGGGPYQAVINTQAQPIAPPAPPATTVDTTGKTQPAPPFCRLNEDPSGNDQSEGKWPRDHIQVGGIARRQATQGGLYKFNQKPDLPANGTVDDVQFWQGGSRPSADLPTLPDRYEEKGVWTNEFDLSSRFFPGSDFLDLGNIQFTAYLPTYYGDARAPGGAGRVRVSFKIIRQDLSEITVTPNPPANDGWIRELTDNSGLAGFKLLDANGTPAAVSRTDRLVYIVELFPGCLQGASLGDDGFSCASPAFDDITLVYFLPTARVLLKERMWD